MDRFSKTLRAGWSDIDFNLHMRNTAYLDKAVDVRMMFFAESGFPVAEFLKRGIGPVMKTDSIDYHRELKLHEEFLVTLEASGAAEDGSRFRLRNDIVKLDGTLAARVTSIGGWLDLKARKLISPPADLYAVMQKMSRVAEFEILPSSRK
ncbi:MAG TPA: thioesterase family protein [Steroidobacteraceae bacterium]|nr:thioesterase family protein [Steroidobacteraceae bacterium]